MSDIGTYQTDDMIVGYDVKNWSSNGWAAVDELMVYPGLDETYIADDTSLSRFNLWYQGIHGYLSLLVCSFGVLSNVINIIVLTRRSMATPTNFLLTAVAVTDVLKMTSYWPFAVYFYCYAVMDKSYNHCRSVDGVRLYMCLPPTPRLRPFPR